MRFKVGQEIVCVCQSFWKREKALFTIFGVKFFTRYVRSIGPKANEIVTVAGYGDPYYLFLKEYPLTETGTKAAFDECGFEPVVPSQTIEELMNSLQEQL